MQNLPNSRVKRISLFALAAVFIVGGVNHFVNAAFYTAMMPPYLPAHLELVYLSGAFEILGGAGVLVARVRSLAGWGLIALLVAVFPANLQMALNPELFPDVPPNGLYARLPVQLIFIAWTYWTTRDELAQPD